MMKILILFLCCLLSSGLVTPAAWAEDRTRIDRSQMGGSGSRLGRGPSLSPVPRLDRIDRYSNGYSAPGGMRKAELNHCRSKCRIGYGKYLQYCQANMRGEAGAQCIRGADKSAATCVKSCAETYAAGRDE